MTLGNVFNIMRRALGEHWSPLDVHFTMADQSAGTIIRKLFIPKFDFNRTPTP